MSKIDSEMEITLVWESRLGLNGTPLFFADFLSPIGRIITFVGHPISILAPEWRVSSSRFGLLAKGSEPCIYKCKLAVQKYVEEHDLL